MWKVLIPVDGSQNAMRAVQYAAGSIKRDPQQEFILLNVQEPYPLRTHAVLSHDEINRMIQEEGEKVLKPARAVLDQAGARYTVRCLSGAVDEVIGREVDASGADAIVMGSRGAGAAANLVLGSVATKVLHHVKVPVTVVR